MFHAQTDLSHSWMGNEHREGFDRPDLELAREDVVSLLDRISRSVVDRAFMSDGPTVGARSRADIDSLLLPVPPRAGLGSDALVELVEHGLHVHSRNFRHPMHYGHQRPAPLLATAAADLAASASNPAVSLYESGPFSVALERRTVEWMLKIFGFPDGSGGTMTNGGSEGTLTALLCAREMARRSYPEVSFNSFYIFTSEDAHYSVDRARHVIGLPDDNLIRIPTDRSRRMEMDRLAEALAQCRASAGIPIAIVATAGTTAVSAFDDLATSEALARQYGAWLHVDAIHGGAAVFSDTHRHKLRGIGKADSVAWNPHKLMWVSPPCSFLLMRQQRQFDLLLSPGIRSASYIGEPVTVDDDHGVTDLGNPLGWTLACTRFFSAFKVYSALLVYGLDGMASRIDRMAALATDLHDRLGQHPDFCSLCPPEFNITCFSSLGSGNSIDKDRISALNDHVRTRLASDTKAYITGVRLDDQYWLRAQMMSPGITDASNELLLKLISDCASAILEEEGGNGDPLGA